jgi:hypothetical protein
MLREHIHALIYFISNVFIQYAFFLYCRCCCVKSYGMQQSEFFSRSCPFFLFFTLYSLVHRFLPYIQQVWLHCTTYGCMFFNCSYWVHFQLKLDRYNNFLGLLFYHLLRNMKLNFLQHKKFFSISSHKKFQMTSFMQKSANFFFWLLYFVW